MVPRVLNLSKAAVHHASLSAARCESEAEDEKEKGGVEGGGVQKQD